MTDRGQYRQAGQEAPARDDTVPVHTVRASGTYVPLVFARDEAFQFDDELKNQWDRGGFTTHDLKRFRLIAGVVALVYNWWNLFVRLANPGKRHEAITSRPLLLHGVTTKTRHGGQTTLTITSQHAKQAAIQAVLIRIAAFLASLRSTTEQFTDAERLALILRRAFAKFLRGRLGHRP